MVTMKCFLIFAAAVFSSAAIATIPEEDASAPCQADKLAVYKVVLHTFWSRVRFPKHYPDWRPPAQWSKLVGRSHDNSFYLFRLGAHSSSGVKTLAETGKSDGLDTQSQGEGGIFDAFSAPPINTGVGRTEAEFFVDGNHSKVSLMSKIIPSPDWFIGLDSFDLCVNGNWIDTITIEVDPLDAGTDNGFTFTAPNWRTDPQGTVYRITSRFPSHPAGSFYYPYLEHLPAIATLQFIKLKSYELNEVFRHDTDDRHYDLLRTAEKGRHNSPIDNNEIQLEMEEERKEEEAAMTLAGVETTTIMTTTTPEPSNAIDFTSPLSRVLLPSGDKNAIMNSIVQTYRNGGKEYTRRRKYRSKVRKNIPKIRPPRDCRVSEWSEWSQCSQSCGIGEMRRTRRVTKPARRGGNVCPPLVETKWCGSARACPRQHFDW